ncbi:MAG: RNA polymerase sigma factor [Gammaproteobacteria bacterium]|nr:RNA polymerase sigma factor [Gammaproteobacteria bacterium]MYL00466.1 RNA polymerase sigma factor [Gammaproteobacteria bacterium]
MRPLRTPEENNIVHVSSRARPGRKRLVARLLAQHDRALRLFLQARSVPKDQIEDLIQELYARLLVMDRLEEKMSESTGSNRTYLRLMANHLFVDHQRKSHVRGRYSAAQREIERERFDDRTPERIVAAQLELEAIKAVILDLPVNWRVAFVLQRFRNMSYEDIALHMGVTIKQVEHYIVRALRRVRKARRKIRAAGEKTC